MTTLYKTATPPQRALLRIIEGAVMNAAHVHQGHGVTRTFARSVAKRAVGTLSAQFAEVLATDAARAHRLKSRQVRARRASNKTGRKTTGRSDRHQNADLVMRAGRVSRTGSFNPRHPCRRIFNEIARRIGPAKREGKTERVETLIEIARIVDQMRKAGNL